MHNCTVNQLQSNKIIKNVIMTPFSNLFIFL